MDEKSDKTLEVKAKEPRPSKKPKPPPKRVLETSLVDWEEIGQKVEAEIRERGWTKTHQRRNPRYLDGLIRRMVLRPLVQAIHKNL